MHTSMLFFFFFFEVFDRLRLNVEMLASLSSLYEEPRSQVMYIQKMNGKGNFVGWFSAIEDLEDLKASVIPHAAQQAAASCHHSAIACASLKCNGFSIKLWNSGMSMQMEVILH